MNDVVYWILDALMLVSLGLNIYGCFLSARSWKRARKQWEIAADMVAGIEGMMDKVREKVAEEIFDKIEGVLVAHSYRPKSEDYAAGACDTLEWVDSQIDKVKEAYLPTKNTETTNIGEEQS
jgi:hypothetical protein